MPRFEKDQLFDGFDPGGFYQMVPVSESRGDLNVFSDTEEIFVEFDTPNIARFGQRDPPYIQRSHYHLDDQHTYLPPLSRLTFELIGIKSGTTNLVIKDKEGDPIIDPKTGGPITSVELGLTVHRPPKRF